jgi:hypothetical protein
VSQIRLDRPGLPQGALTYGFSAETFSTGGHKAWKVVRDAAVFGEKPGSMDSSVEPAEFQRLVGAVNTPAFFALQPRYAGSQPSSSPATLTVTCDDGRAKTVTVDGARAPAAFQSAVDALLGLSAGLFWVS